MCYFVTMVLPPGADVDHVQQVLGRYHRGFRILRKDRYVANLLKRRELYFIPSPRQCDCDTKLGSTYRASMYRARADAVAPDFTSNVQKLRRKGWGEAKIAQWREQKQSNWYAKIRLEESYLESPEESSSKYPGDLDDWANIIRDLRAEAGLGYVGILLHRYSGESPDRIEGTRKKLQFDDDIKASLAGIEEDVLYIVS